VNENDQNREGAAPRRVPGPRSVRPQRSAAGRVFYSLFLALSIFALVGFGVAAWGYKTFTSPGPLAANKVFEIQKGLRTPEIAAALAKEGIISDQQVFTVAASVAGARGRLKAGEYEFPAAASMRDVLAIIESGKAILYKLSIPEGWTTWQALERVKANEVLAGDLTVKPAEGDILPDTYLFRRGKTRDELVKDMVTAQNKIMKELWEKRAAASAVKTPQDAVILASIVEKETGIAEERPRIAAVFGNRLAARMRLQSDPTIIYGITKGQGKLDRSLRKSDILEKTDYNTYQIAGLPPGPIANPGKAALEAVLNPLQTKELYFVADGTGGHAFAETLEEHNANVKKWREIDSNRGQVELATEEEGAKAPDDQAAAAAPAPEVAMPAPDAAAPAPGTEAVLPGEITELAPAGAPLPGTAPAATDGKVVARLPEMPAADDAAAAKALDDAAKAKALEDTKKAEDLAKAEAAKKAEDAATMEAARKAEDAAKAAKAEEDAKAAAAAKLDADAKKAAEAKKVAAVEKPAETGAGAAKKPEPVADLKPGTVVKLAKRLVPIPKPKPKVN
jgi:UPF0755 protein